jgi:exopolysaccharide biosynthesis predicted pyruvyltransferase EpsI
MYVIQLTLPDYQPTFFIISSNITMENIKRILVIGFYNRGNLGDEAFKPAFQKLLASVHNHTAAFICVDDLHVCSANDYDVIIIGGGDIFNSYFMPRIEKFTAKFKGLLLAVGIGVPFISIVRDLNLKKYNAIFTRNAEDVSFITHYSHSMRAHFLPDIVFALDCPTNAMCHSNDTSRPLFNDQSRKISVRSLLKSANAKMISSSHSPQTQLPKCGVFLVQNNIKFEFIMHAIESLLNVIAKTHQIVFYIFNSGVNPHENDEEISREIASKINNTRSI